VSKPKIDPDQGRFTYRLADPGLSDPRQDAGSTRNHREGPQNCNFIRGMHNDRVLASVLVGKYLFQSQGEGNDFYAWAR